MTLANYTQFLEQFGDVNDELLVDVVAHGKRVFYDPRHNLEWCEEHNITPHSFGTFLGETKGHFRPSPQCIERAAKYSKDKAIIDAKAAWLFLCGRDIFGRALIQGTPEHGEPVFVYDENHNLLGYGLWEGDKAFKNKPVIMHKADRGEYLRRK